MTKQMDINKTISTIQKKYGIVGRDQEMENLIHCINADKHVLLEGPVGVGKTYLVNAVSAHLGKDVVRVDGDSRYTEQKLSGWFDPPTVLKKGYKKESYFDGPLATAMKNGSILFINELNRLPESVQNILLPALDEQMIEIPKIGKIKAKKGFRVIATMNPREFVATTQISEALLDRFELILLDYQSEAQEKDILKQSTSFAQGKENQSLVDWCTNCVRNTRTSPLFKRGASIRAAISIYDIAINMGGDWEAFDRACKIALPTRTELSDNGLEEGIEQAIESLFAEFKKKN